MSKQIHFADDARQKMFEWIEKVKNTVSATMWPKWRNVIFSKEYWAPIVTNDWVTIAKEIELEDPLENMWASLIKEAAENTNKIALDWTTTATLLTWALIKEWLREIRSWINAVELKDWMLKAWYLVTEFLKENATPVDTPEKIEQVATISSQDKNVWKIIAHAMSKVWKDWIITVEEWQTFWLEVEVTEWMQIDSWYVSPYMINNSEKMEAKLENSYILVTDQKINSLPDLLPVLEELANSWTRDLVIIAEDIESEALTWIILNKLKWALNILAIKAPWFWDSKKEILKDIAVLTWADLILEELWLKLSDVKMSHLWKARSIIATKNNTTIIWWEWDKDAIKNRILEIRNEIELETSEYTKDSLAKRLAKLAWWIAVIKVWAATEVEMKEKKLRIEDALNSTRAATLEWVVAGWWTALIKASTLLEEQFSTLSSEDIWARIVARALKYPVKKIADNAWKEWAVIANKVLDNNNINYWYDAWNDKYVDMLEVWIIDPTRVERAALENSISIAWMFLTTEAVISNTKDNKDLNSESPAGIPWMGWMWWMPMM